MDTTLTVALLSIALFFLLFILLFLFRERVEVQVENDCLLLRYPFKKRKISLDKELVSWKVQEAYYLRLGMIHAINMLLKNGKRIAINSRLNQENYDRLYDYLSSNYKNRREYED